MEKSGPIPGLFRESGLLVLVTDQTMSAEEGEDIKDCALISTSCRWVALSSLMGVLLDEAWSWRYSVQGIFGAS